MRFFYKKIQCYKRVPSYRPSIKRMSSTARVICKYVFGYIGLALFATTLVPQLWQNYQRKSVHGISEVFFLTLTVSTVCFAIYVIVQNLALPVILDPELYTAVSLGVWAQFFRYKRYFFSSIE